MNNSPVVQTKNRVGVRKEIESPGLEYVNMAPELGKVTRTAGLWKLMKNAWLGKGNLTSGLEILKYSPCTWHLPLFFLDDSHTEHIHQQVSGKDKL